MKETTKVEGISAQDRANELFLNSEILAPMVRASTAPLRALALSYGADLVYTEEIVDRSITTCQRTVNEELGTIDYVRPLTHFSPKVQKRIQAAGEGLPVVLRIVPSLEKGKLIYQMGTGESNLALPAATAVAQDVDGIDINMGCPKKFSVSGGMGSALLTDMPRACDIIKTLRRNISLPISAKIRIIPGEFPKNTIDFVQGLIQAGANAVTIHARLPGDESTQLAKWDQLVDVINILKTTGNITSSEGGAVPIIINGDLYTRNHMINMRRKCLADGIMLARPALYNTSIFRKPSQIEHGQSTGRDQSLDKQEETRYGYNSPLLKSKTEVIQDYLHFANLYQSNPKNIKYVICEMMTNRRTPPTLAHYMPQSYPGKQTIDKVCKCKTMESLCKLWDVSTSIDHKLLNTMTSKNNSSAIDGHNYDDKYFLDPETFRKERMAKESLLHANKSSRDVEANSEESHTQKRMKTE